MRSGRDGDGKAPQIDRAGDGEGITDAAAIAGEVPDPAARAEEGGKPIPTVTVTPEVTEPRPQAAPMSAYKRPESVLVVVFTGGGDFLMLRRTSPAKFWQSVTGSLKRGESPRYAALRELREETGLELSPSALWDLRHSERFPILPAWRGRYAQGVRTNLEHWFAVALPGRRLIRLNPWEHRESRWVGGPQQAAAMATSWTNRKAILALAQSVQVLRWGSFPPLENRDSGGLRAH